MSSSEGSIKTISGLTWQDVSKDAVEFAVACLEMNSIDELTDPHSPGDASPDDCKIWDISSGEWSWAIETARVAKELDASILSNGEIVF